MTTKCLSFTNKQENKKIALGYKKAEDNPWFEIEKKHQIDEVLEVKVKRVVPFGIFVELETGVDALLHVSQISKDHIEKPADALKVGDEVTAKVVDFNEADKKISLSVKALLAPEAEESKEEEEADVVSVDVDAVIAEQE